MEEGAIHVIPMAMGETEEIFFRAEELFEGAMSFQREVVTQIASLAQGYPYFAQLIGKECVNHSNRLGATVVTSDILNRVLEDVKSGRAFPTLESAYQRAIGNSPDRELLLHLLADQPESNTMFNEEVGKVVLKAGRKDAQDLDVQYVDQLLPRLVDPKDGPVLRRVPERQGVYEFENPVSRLYVTLRAFSF